VSTAEREVAGALEHSNFSYLSGVMTAASEYTLDNAWKHARERLALLEALADPGTIRHLETLGVAAGWRCWEAGGGGGSIAAWLCERVGPTGHVIATDVDTRFLAALAYQNLDVRRHDIVAESPPEGGLDLVHARALLGHLPQRELVLDRMVAALRPGGCLLIEEADGISKLTDPGNDVRANEVFARVRAAEAAWMVEAGIDQHLGRRVCGALLRRGLVALGAEGRVPVVQGGSELARFYRLSAQQSRARYLGAGVSEQDFDAFLSLHDDPAFVWIQATIFAAWGRRAE
jgi:SAM-dependent methyltransferase